MARVESKVTAGSLSAAGAGAALWALQTWVFHGSAVPDGLVSLVYLAVPAVLAGAAGYLAPHTPRPVAAAAPVTTHIFKASDELTEAEVERLKQAFREAVQKEPPKVLYEDPEPPVPEAAPVQPPGATEPPSPEAAV